MNRLILSNDPVAADARAALPFGKNPEKNSTNFPGKPASFVAHPATLGKLLCYLKEKL